MHLKSKPCTMSSRRAFTATHNPSQDMMSCWFAQWSFLGMSEREDFCLKEHAKDVNRPIQLLIPLLQDTDTSIRLQGKFL